jgi:hypothetical protein
MALFFLIPGVQELLFPSNTAEGAGQDLARSAQQAQQSKYDTTPQRVVRQPFPGADQGTSINGLSTAIAEKCKDGRCKFVVPQNQSTSVVTLVQTRSTAAAELTDEATSDEKSTETDDAKPCGEGNEERDRVRLDSRLVRVTCFAPCPNENVSGKDQQRVNRGSRDRCEFVNQTESIWVKDNKQAAARPTFTLDIPVKGLAQAETAAVETSTVRFASNKKLFIVPDKPFNITYDGVDHAIRKMTIYRPCPYRIENVQADAVLSLNDFSDSEATFVALIPLSAQLRYGKPGEFVERVMQNVNGFVPNEETNQYEPLTIPVGHDWQLTNVLEATQDPAPKKTLANPEPDQSTPNTVTGGFFTWQNKRYEEHEASRATVTGADGKRETVINYEWREIPGESVRTVLFEKPAGISYLTSTYLQLLAYAPSSESAPSLPHPDKIAYRKAKCTTCANGFQDSYEDVEAILQQSKDLLDPKSLAFLISTFLIMAIALIAIYFALDSALGGNGRFFMSGPVSIAGWLAGPPTRPQ